MNSVDYRLQCTKAQIEISNASIARKSKARIVHIQRILEAEIQGETLIWNQAFDFRCAEGWEIVIKIICAVLCGNARS